MNNLTNELKTALIQFDVKQAIELSDKIHWMESTGYELSEYQDSLWFKLTEKIEESKKQ